MKTNLSCTLAAVLLAGGCARDVDVPTGKADIVASTITPVTAHPRLWVRAADLPRLQGWASAQNPMWTQGLSVALTAAVNNYDAQFYPGGQPNPTWPDPGTDTWVAYPTEDYAEFFAFMSLVDPTTSNRPVHAARARNLLMHVMNEAVKGIDTSASPAPFRSRKLATYDRSRWWGEAYGLTVDWIYPYLSASDKATIQKVFLLWAGECLHAHSTSEEHPQPVGTMNDPALLSDKMQLRWAANNYYAGHARNLTLMSLALDAADDPPVDAGAPVTQLGNTMRSYLADVTGAWLYQQYAVFEDPAVSSAALGVPAEGLGVASGGLPAEGFLYGASLGFLLEGLWALHTAGQDDPAVVGPQAGLVTSGFWDRVLAGYLQSLAPAEQAPFQSGDGYLGQIWQMANYGDTLQFWVTPDQFALFGAMGAFDQTTDNTARLPAIRWFTTHVLQGGAAQLYTRASKVWNDGNGLDAILYFMLFDPAAPAPADPRPAMPTTFTDKARGRVIARTQWGPESTWWSFLCGWETINHQQGNCGQFELYRNGEWLTRERSGYGNDGVAMTSDYHNTLGLQNDVPSNLQGWEQATSTRGGQWTNGMNAGDPTVLTSSAEDWVYAFADATNLYMRPNPWSAAETALDVTHASRSIVWLKPDLVVVYDRATSKTAGRFKRFNLTLLSSPTISGKTATVTTAGGQKLYIESLLPARATLTVSAAENFRTLAGEEPTNYRLMIQDPSNPTDVRFLHVLQGADGGTAQSPATVVSSTRGTPFQGAAVAGRLVLFPVSTSAAFTGTTYTAPAGVTEQIVTGLTPGAGYGVSISGSTVTVSPNGSAVADAAGVLVVSGGAGGQVYTVRQAAGP